MQHRRTLNAAVIPAHLPYGTDSLKAEQTISMTNRVAPEGLLVVNADDWGRDREITGRSLDCIRHGTVNAVSAMVFMEDSERAAEIAMASGIDAGLHLNLTTPFSAPSAGTQLRQRQQELTRYLRRHTLFRAVVHPGLAGCAEYVVKAQIEEFRKLYGSDPQRLDGHHHMHLWANVLLAGLLPAGTMVRRNISFRPDEKSLLNRLYRRVVDWRLARRHSLTDYFFCLAPVEPEDRLRCIFSLAQSSIVEVETHPVVEEEYRFLMGDAMLRLSADVPRGTFRKWRQRAC